MSRTLTLVRSEMSRLQLIFLLAFSMLLIFAAPSRAQRATAAIANVEMRVLVIVNSSVGRQ